MEDHPGSTRKLAALAAALLAALPMSAAKAEQVSSNIYRTNVEVVVEPFAYLEFVGSNLLHLEVPPSGSTAPSSGVRFVVTGNAIATVTAEPTDFMQVDGEGYVGRATLGTEGIGYKLEVRFPRLGASGSPVQIAGLPGFEAAPTTPLSVDLTLTGMQREGEIHMETDPYWTPHGGIPLPGTYTGSVTLTLIAG